MRKFIFTIRYTVCVKGLGNSIDLHPYFFWHIDTIVYAQTLSQAIYKAIQEAKKEAHSCNRCQEKAVEENKIYFDVRLKMKE